MVWRERAEASVVVRAQDRPARKEGGLECRERPERSVSQVPLKLADQVVQQADEAQRRLGGRLSVVTTAWKR